MSHPCTLSLVLANKQPKNYSAQQAAFGRQSAAMAFNFGGQQQQASHLLLSPRPRQQVNYNEQRQTADRSINLSASSSFNQLTSGGAQMFAASPNKQHQDHQETAAFSSSSFSHLSQHSSQQQQKLHQATSSSCLISQQQQQNSGATDSIGTSGGSTSTNGKTPN